MGRRSPALITLHGVDGTGKSTQAALLAERLSGLGLPTVVIWNRWTPHVVGLVRRAVGGILGKRGPAEREEQVADVVAEAVAQRPAVAYLFSRVAWLEYLVQTRWRLLRHGRGARVIVMDRYVADMVVDRARRLGWSDERIAREVALAYRRGYPKPVLNVFLDSPLATVVARRPEELPRALEERSQLYRRAAGALEAPIVDAAGTIDTVAGRIWEIVDASAITAGLVTK
jgi:thymidylate kinase